MATSKSVLVLAAVIAAAVCVPIGYQLHPANANPPGTSVKRISGADSRPLASPVPARPGFETTALFAEWRVLHLKHGTNAQAMPALYKAVAEITDPFRRRAFRTALIAEWAEVDPLGGLEFFGAKGRDEDQRRQFAAEWLALDPNAALQGLIAATGVEWKTALRDCLPEVARRAPSRLAEVTSRLPRAEWYFDSAVRDAFAIVAQSQLSNARSAAEAVTGECREQALAGVAQAWAKTDFDAALSWAKSLPSQAGRDEAIRSALVGKAVIDPAAALDAISMVPAGGRHAHAESTTGARVLGEAAKANFDAALAWIEAHPGRLGHEDLMGLSSEVTRRLNVDPVAFLQEHSSESALAALSPAIGSAILNAAKGQRGPMWNWLKDQPETGQIQALREEIVRATGYQDPEMALRIVADLPKGPEGDSVVTTLARALLNGGNMAYRFDALLEQAPERLRQPLIDAGFKLLNPMVSGNGWRDLEPWLARVAGLPETSREPAIASVARAWTMQVPEEAIGWAATLPERSRPTAYAAIVAAMTPTDAPGAANLITTLAAGPERDQSSAAFAIALADRYPSEAWNWALTISDSAERARAAEQVAKAVGSRDPAIARKWIDAGPFTLELKTQLRAALDRRATPAP